MKSDSFPQDGFRQNAAPIPPVFTELDDTYDPPRTPQKPLSPTPAAIIISFLLLVIVAELALILEAT